MAGAMYTDTKASIINLNSIIYRCFRTGCPVLFDRSFLHPTEILYKVSEYNCRYNLQALSKSPPTFP